MIRPSIFRCKARFYSTIADISASIKSGKVQGIHEIIPNAMNSAQDPQQISQIFQQIEEASNLDAAEKNRIVNSVLAHGLSKNFSLYYKLNKHHVWTPEALESLIKANPGRVDQSWDLWKRHGSLQTQGILEAVIGKLLFGETVEIRDQDIEITLDRLGEALSLIYLSDGAYEISPEMLYRLVEVSHQLGVVSSVGFAIKAEKLIPLLTEFAKDDAIFIQLFSIIFREKPSLLDMESISKALTIDAHNENTTQLQKILQLKSGLNKIEFNQVIGLDELLEYIKINKLDLDKSPESLLIRLKLLYCYGIYKLDLTKALELFHQYQTHAKFGIELVQNNMCTVFCYQAIYKHNDLDLKIAETLLNSQVPINLVSHLILARCEFGVEKGLELYNEYIPHVSKKGVQGRKSPSSVITEAMILGALYNNDREFANLLFEKAIQNQIFGDETEIANAKRLFKIYGDAFAQDTWESAQPKLKEEVLRRIKSSMI